MHLPLVFARQARTHVHMHTLLLLTDNTKCSTMELDAVFKKSKAHEGILHIKYDVEVRPDASFVSPACSPVPFEHEPAVSHAITPAAVPPLPTPLETPTK